MQLKINTFTVLYGVIPTKLKTDKINGLIQIKFDALPCHRFFRTNINIIALVKSVGVHPKIITPDATYVAKSQAKKSLYLSIR